MNRTFRKLVCLLVGLGFIILASSCVVTANGDPVAPTKTIAPAPHFSAAIQDSADGLTEALAEEMRREVARIRESASVEVEVIETLDRTKPIYEVYKGGYPVPNATAEVQWIIRDITTEYDLPEKMIYGLILAESTFVPNLESFDGGCWGLAQINTFWITRANITHFTDDYRSRDLCDPYDNILTLAELMCYARDTYGLDYENRADLVKYLYWHNCGQDPTWVTRWDYATRALGYADELVTLQS